MGAASKAPSGATVHLAQERRRCACRGREPWESTTVETSPARGERLAVWNGQPPSIMASCLSFRPWRGFLGVSDENDVSTFICAPFAARLEQRGLRGATMVNQIEANYQPGVDALPVDQGRDFGSCLLWSALAIVAAMLNAKFSWIAVPVVFKKYVSIMGIGEPYPIICEWMISFYQFSGLFLPAFVVCLVTMASLFLLWRRRDSVGVVAVVISIALNILMLGTQLLGTVLLIKRFS
jgi:hypothetical protein